MATDTVSYTNELQTAAGYMPCVSIIMPFTPAFSLKTGLEYKLKTALDQVKKELQANYTAEKAMMVLNRLQSLIQKLDYTSNPKSLAIFVSPLIEKVYYLDTVVEERIIIDDSFEIRDLVFSKNEMQQYLLLIISSKKSRVFLGTNQHLSRISNGIPEHAVAFTKDTAERVANFTDPSDMKELMLDKYMRQIDDHLSQLLKEYPFPVMVMGTSRTAGHFKKISRTKNRVISFIHGNYDEATTNELMKAAAPALTDWRKSKEAEILHQIEAAMDARKLATGIAEVWKAATNKRGKLLVIEKNYMFPAQRGDHKDEIFAWDRNNANKLYIKDAVDDVIEMVLANGGEVAFVDQGALKNYSSIALIEFY